MTRSGRQSTVRPQRKRQAEGSSILDVRDRWGRHVAAILVLGLAIAGCGPSTATPSPTAAPSGLARFAEQGLVFEYPAAWRVFHYQKLSSFSSVIAYLATVGVADPCARTASSVSCGLSYHLDPGTIVVTVSNAAFPTFNILDVPPGAFPVDVGGLPGYVTQTGRHGRNGLVLAVEEDEGFAEERGDPADGSPQECLLLLADRLIGGKGLGRRNFVPHPPRGHETGRISNRR